MRLVHRQFANASKRRAQLYQQYVRRSGPFAGRFMGLGEEPATTSWMDNITSFAKQIAPIYSQVTLLREQAKRRQAGLPPLDPAQFAPTVRVEAGAQTLNLGKMALYGGLAIGAAMLAKSFMR